MADDPTPDGNSSASNVDFHEIAKSAGVKMKTALQEVRDRTSDTEGYIKFEIKDHEDILNATVKKFETEVSCNETKDVVWALQLKSHGRFSPYAILGVDWTGSEGTTPSLLHGSTRAPSAKYVTMYGGSHFSWRERTTVANLLICTNMPDLRETAFISRISSLSAK